MVKFYRRADKIMRLKTTREAIHTGKSTPVEKSNDNGKKWKNEDRQPFLEKANKKSKAPDLRVSRCPLSKFTNYTDFISS